MKSWKIAVPMIMALCLASFAAAAEMSTGSSGMKGHLTLAGVGGITVPTGALKADFVDNGAQMGMGWDAGASLDWFFTDQVAFGVDALYGSMNAKDVVGGDLRAKTMQGGVHGKWFIPTGGKLMPWLGAGFAMYNRKIAIEPSGGGGQDFSDTKPGANFGVGADYMMTESVGLGVNGMYDLTFGKWEQDTDNDGITDATLDDWNFIRFNAALTFHFPSGGAK